VAPRKKKWTWSGADPPRSRGICRSGAHWYHL